MTLIDPEEEKKELDENSKNSPTMVRVSYLDKVKNEKIIVSVEEESIYEWKGVKYIENPNPDPDEISDEIEVEIVSSNSFYDQPSFNNDDNPWIEVFGEGEEADAAYWNTQ